jgi:hypothetical protein
MTEYQKTKKKSKIFMIGEIVVVTLKAAYWPSEGLVKGVITNVDPEGNCSVQIGHHGTFAIQTKYLRKVL